MLDRCNERGLDITAEQYPCVVVRQLCRSKLLTSRMQVHCGHDSNRLRRFQGRVGQATQHNTSRHRVHRNRRTTDVGKLGRTSKERWHRAGPLKPSKVYRLGNAAPTSHDCFGWHPICGWHPAPSTPFSLRSTTICDPVSSTHLICTFSFLICRMENRTHVPRAALRAFLACTLGKEGCCPCRQPSTK